MTEIRSEERKTALGVFGNAYAYLALRRKAGDIIEATKRSEEAKTQLLYSLPGIFAMELRYSGRVVRLIKEGDTFRLMGSAEKSNILLVVEFSDVDAGKGSFVGKVSVARLLAEGRVSYRGRGRYFNAFVRVAYIADKVLLSDKKFRSMYGMEKENA